jgi:beta-glucosidase
MGVGMYGESKQRGWTLGQAEGADVVVACFGLDNAMEGEEGESVETIKGDRETIELPKWQLDYLQAAKERGTPIVLVLTGGSAIAFPREIADAILMVWYPGEEGGNAVADVIFGDAIPEGHLPVTFPKSTEDLPDFADYSMKNRTYRYIEKEPLFPFGFGLSYTTFAFENMDVAKNGDSIKVCVDVKNTGDVDASNAVQLYIAKKNRTETDPICSLKAFEKIFVKANGTEKVTFELSTKDFESINEEGESVLVSGEYNIIVADSSPSDLSEKLGATKSVIKTISL